MGRRYGGLGFRRGWGTLVDCQEASESISSKESLPVSVVIRMKRMGRKNRAFYRICATDKRSPRDGRFIEKVVLCPAHVLHPFYLPGYFYMVAKLG